ncbi:hypothetical protein O3M35_012361 [Rhynocoris fuscipes]|uniref:Uncharacterized protein n=1 Tax=Rhynocoris fuscipes TaxID=488301 RepID=A0AAW1CSV9_9HEMI
MKWKDSIILDEIEIKFKNINITGWKNWDSGASTFKLSNHADGSTNMNYVDLIVPADDVKIDIEEISIGVLKIHLWFDIEESLIMMNISSSTNVSNPAECSINLNEMKFLTVSNVIMHSDNKQYDGKDITEAVNMILPFVNILIKSKSFENYLQNAAEQVCKVQIIGAD